MADDEVDRLRQFGRQMQKKHTEKNRSSSGFSFHVHGVKQSVSFFLSISKRLKHVFVLLMKTLKKMYRLIKKKIGDIDLAVHIWMWKKQFDRSAVKNHHQSSSRLVEIKKQKGDTVVIIRKRLPFRSEDMYQCSSSDAMSYYFHEMSVKKSCFHPRKSIWDFPVYSKKHPLKKMVHWLFK